MHKKSKLIVLLLILSGGWLHAQKSTLSLSLNEAEQYAREHAYQAVYARYDVESSIKKIWETTAMGLPQIDANADYNNFIKQPVTLIPAQAFDPDAPEGEFTPVVFGTKNDMGVGITGRQLVFDGSYIVGLQAAQTFRVIAELAKEKTEIAIKEAVVNAYGGVLIAEENWKLIGLNLENSEKTLKETEIAFNEGLVEEQDVEQLQITVSNLKTEVDRANRQVIVARKLLNYTLGVPVRDSIALTDELDDVIVQNLNLGALARSFNLEQNIDYKISDNNIQNKNNGVRYERTKFYPKLDAFISHSQNAFSNTFSFFDGGQDWFGTTLFGLSLKIPVLSSGMRKATVAQAKIELEKARLEQEELGEKLRLDIERAKNTYQYAIDQYSTQKDNLELAQKIRNKEEIKYREGISSSFRLSEAIAQLYNTQQRYLESISFMIKSKAELDKIYANN